MTIKYIAEPNPLACGQAVLAMLTGSSAEEVIDDISNARETDLKTMRAYLAERGMQLSERRAADNIELLPQVCLLSLETPKCWHWSLLYRGVFFDPQYGILTDWPPSSRRYYFAVTGSPVK